MWLSQENEDQRRTQDRQPQTPSGTQTADHRLTFPKTARILFSSHFKHLLKSGSRLSGETLNVNFRMGRSTEARLGITVSRKHGKSHDRNRFKRCVREAFRLLYPTLPKGLEINVCPKFSPLPLDGKKIFTDISTLVDKIRSLQNRDFETTPTLPKTDS